ncbi:hypothetical protein SAMN07250955_10661 [Arboricoccus pini]|uniref:Uncharacterized protein n=1 Tax=Arboricoccus pini TaxID=1963835 RepID=A0A212R6Q1_9PROT|nr:hypothetical protein [Arboricoccus pini]SNB67819.1 hypothetical protein SAMN07250955_10661 [Arboricoccus pini]
MRTKQPLPWAEGDKIGSTLFTFLSEAEGSKPRKAVVACACSPGMPVTVEVNNLKSGNTTSCGCRRGRNQHSTKRRNQHQEEEDMGRPYKPQWRTGESIGNSPYILKEELGLLPTGSTVTRHILLTCTGCGADRPIQLSNAKRGTLHCPTCGGSDYLEESERLEREQERLTYEASKADEGTAADLYAALDEIEGRLRRLKRERAIGTDRLYNIPLPPDYRWYNRPTPSTPETHLDATQMAMQGPAWIGLDHCLRVLSFDCHLAGWPRDTGVPRWRMVEELAANLPSACPYTGEELNLEGTWCAAGRPPHGHHPEGHKHWLRVADPETADLGGSYFFGPRGTFQLITAPKPPTEPPRGTPTVALMDPTDGFRPNNLIVCSWHALEKESDQCPIAA